MKKQKAHRAQKVKVQEKIDPARVREAEELRKIIGFTKTLVLSGVGIALVGCLLSTATDSDLLLWVLGIPGFLVSVIGYVQNLRRAKCPACDGFLGAMPSIARTVPERCPHCGRKW